MKKYLVKDFKEGLHEYDTIFVEVDKEMYQIPVLKEAKADQKLIGKSIGVEKLDTPIEKILLDK